MTGNIYFKIKLLKNPFLKAFPTIIKVLGKKQDYKKLFNKDIYFSLQSNNTKYIKPFKFIT